MPEPGHRPVTNRDDRRRPLRDRTETARLPRTDRPTLVYYRPPTPRTQLLEAGILEGSPSDVSPMGSLPDAAAGSFGDTTVLEVVIGNDDRVRVGDGLLRINPWRQICALRIRAQTGKMFVGTGWFIGPRTIATAGHCVFMQKERGWAESIEIIPAKAGRSEPFGRAQSQHFASVDGWVDGSERDFDYGVIFVSDSTLGTRLGNFEVRALADGDLQGTQAKISGYPADLERAEFQYFHERPMIAVTPSRLTYDIDTFGGQSGSPIWQDTEEGGLVAVGIHTTGGASSNSGTRIGEPVLDNLILWTKE